MTWNSIRGGASSFELLTSFEDALRAVLPDDWLVEELRDPRIDDQHDWPDALYRLVTPSGEVSTVLVEVKERQVEPRSLPAALHRMRLLGDVIQPAAMVVIGPFLSRLSQERLTQANVGWFDLTGNLRLRMDYPAVFINDVGASRNPFVDASDRRLKSLRGPAAARITRALCEFPLSVGVRTVAQYANVGPASSSRVLELLTREGLLTRDDVGTVVSVHKRALIRRWADDYSLTGSNQVTTVLDPQGPEHALATVKSMAGEHVVTGSAAARAYLPDGVPAAPLATLVVYAERDVDLIRAAGWRKVDVGANVLVVRPFDGALLKRSQRVDGLRCAARAQVVADLLTGPGRPAAEVEQLINVLASRDPAWAT